MNPIEKVRPCPYCKYELPQVEPFLYKEGAEIQFYVWCASCCCRGPLQTNEKDALERWNERSD